MPSRSTRPRLVLVDGHGLAYRAYHALPPTLATSSGEPTAVVFGFTSMLLEVLNDFEPDYVIVCFDSGKSFRHELYEQYKAHRPETPDDLRHQLERIRQLLAAFRIPIVVREGYEADDLIGTLAKQAIERELEVLVVTGDTDLLQLVDDHVRVILPGRQRFGEYRVYDRQAVLDRYGFPPERLPEFKALVGDPSDNIPGVPGIGEKTATRLIQQFPSLEAMLERLDEIDPPRIREALRTARETVLTSRQLASIVRDAEVELDLDRAQFGYFDRDEVLALFRELEFRSLVPRLPQPRKPVTLSKPIPSQRRAILTEEELEELVRELEQSPAFALDVETTALHPMYAELVGLAIATSPVRSYYIPLGHTTGDVQLRRDAVARALAHFFQTERVQRYTHNGKYDALVLERAGFPRPRIDFDTMIAAYLLGENAVGLKELAFTKLGWEMEAITELIGRGKKQLTMDRAEIARVTAYACADVEATYRLVDVLRPQLEAQNQMRLFRDIELPLIDVLIDMERAGIAIDVSYLQRLSTELDSQLRTLERRIYNLAGHPFNINSPQQLSEILFEELRLPRGKRTKTGYSVSQEVLENLRDAHPIVDAILEYRQLLKLKSTYVDALPRQVHPETGRVHTIFHQTVAATGRLSSSDPNLQNIPVRGELGLAVRRAFVADNRPGYRIADEPILLLSADYSQIELRLMAHFSQDPALLRAFAEGKDIHAATASEVFGVPLDAVTPEMRRIAKVVNFGIMYGMQAYGLARDTGMSRQEAQRFIDAYFRRFPGVARYLEETKRRAAEMGYVETLFGRRRYIPEINSSNPARRQAAERMAVNMPLQGTAADIMKLAMIRVHRALAERHFRARMLLQVHDELVLEVPESELTSVAELVTSLMSSVVALTVPLEVEAKAGPNWADLEPIRVKLSH
ncbi:DNA polymerase I [Thermomicrobium sp. CFH 73360]|uniref:DNA polymerase I n=1 Tax=Thermomicrobium sp. CFH 73360 TaxID=2951987 RepID=UPI00207762BD|nr:DNA polymerase I [Thermomicrobium sp. CFH 73360]MCM8746612.1 DNA polymerase I [Thermomicrobium sp. CFH 73360]